MELDSIRVAVVQAAPVFFDRDATVARVRELTRAAAGRNARLILFPEAFVPAYPRGLSFGAVVGSRTPAGRRLWARYWHNAVPVPGPTTEALGETARQANAYLAIGVIEQEGEYGRGTLYCTLLYFGPDGALLGKHRKLMPTAAERVIWGQGDGSTLTVLDTAIGRVGGLLCWENYMPLARMALYAKGVQIYLAPTADARETWQATLRHIACEGRCFVLGCNQFFARDDASPSGLCDEMDELADAPEILCRGGSAIVSPLGDLIAGPLFDREGILYADLDLGQIIEAKFDFDVTGHYARPDVLRLVVDELPHPPVVWRNAAQLAPGCAQI
jgi:nitrilase